VTTAIWWARRDLRLSDNQALAAALAHAERVIPVFVLDSALLEAHRAAEKRVAFLLGGLRALDESLRERGSGLVVRHGDPADELAALVAEVGADAVFAEEDFAPYARQRDGRVAARVPLRLVGAPIVHRPGSVLKADGTPYVVFTPFSRTWKAHTPPDARDVLQAPREIPSPPGIASRPIPAEPALPSAVPFPPGEAEAHRRLSAFTGGDDPPIYRYAETRDRPDLDDTSRLSPYLRFGMLSARQAVVTALVAADTAPDDRARAGAETWLNELIWREFYVHILYHFPHVLGRSFRPDLQDVPWEDDDDAFAAWCAGRTGYPIVDAAMRQLTQTGWMHNRARMIAASFLVKDLLIDWRWGERFFMQHLVDGDPAANNGGWQWTAGTGTDAAPYFRVFNPVLQGKKHDPQGVYVRRWVPELANVPDRFVHRPWKMKPETQQACGCIVGQDYPAPIVDHAWARERALAAYARARKASEALDA
jgi:deoxyribodipyrimidine photo-lyase